MNVSMVEDEVDLGWRRDFRWRWAAFATSEAGSALGYSALPIVAVLAFGASDFQVSLLSVLAGVVSAVLALPLGPWIEYHRKVPVMVAADLLRFAVIASVPVAAISGVLTYWQLCMVAIVQMVARMAFDSAGVAQLRTLVPRPHRGAANGRFETTLWSANTIGPAVGGVLISRLGATVTMALDALSFLVSALLLRRLRFSEPAPPTQKLDHHWVRDLTAGWRYILGHRGLAALFCNAMIFGGCILALSPLLVVLVLRDLGFAAWQYGLIAAVAGVAGIIGSMLTKPVTKRLGQHRVLLFTGIGRNMWLLLIPFAPASTMGLVMIAASQFLLVFFAGMFSPTFATYRMNAVDDAHMSRVVMTWSITNKIIQPVSIAAAGLLATATSARVAVAVIAAVLLTGIFFLPWHDDPETPSATDDAGVPDRHPQYRMHSRQIRALTAALSRPKHCEWPESVGAPRCHHPVAGARDSSRPPAMGVRHCSSPSHEVVRTVQVRQGLVVHRCNERWSQLLESPMLKKALGASACAGALILALAGPATAAPTATDAAASPSAGIMVTWYPKHVKSTVSSVRVFTSPHGYVEWGAPWGPCTNFDVDRNDNGRYHTLIWYSGIKQDAWVTADPAYVAPGHCG